MRCDSCRDDKPLYPIILRQNIGLFIIRYPSSFQGSMCNKCVHRYFWKMTLTSLVMGWWGIISFFTNCFFIFSNLVEYITFLSTSKTANTVSAPRSHPKLRVIHPNSLERIEEFREQIKQAISSGESHDSICQRFSDFAIVPHSEIDLFINSYLE